MYARHGDLVIKPAQKDQLSKLHKVETPDSVVLAVGEATGHAHRLTGNFEVFTDEMGTPKALAVNESSELAHEEHGNITLEPGEYALGQETEYNTQQQTAYAVAD